MDIAVQPCAYRSFSDEEYQIEDIELKEDLSACDYLLGIKEVEIDQLIPNKTYLFFSHTIKKQAHNRKLLKALVEKRITMIDYETICDASGKRLIAFGKWAGKVGAHNSIWTFGKRTGLFNLPRLCDIKEFKDILPYYEKLRLPPIKIVLTGTGRVANGAAKVLELMHIRKVTPQEFLKEEFEEAVFVQLKSSEMYAANDGAAFDTALFHSKPELFHGIFEPYTKVADIMINGIFWQKGAPVFFTKAEMNSSDFKIKIIGDITCDIAPEASVPSTLYATTIQSPVFGYNPATEKAEKPFQEHVIDVMSIDNLPNELPRDASDEFGDLLIMNVIPELMTAQSDIMDRGTICKDGKLTERYQYLQDYLNG